MTILSAKLKTEPLRNGGIIANYKCTAACRHCLYACSPKRADGYIGAETARTICAALRKGGCRSLHIGGGEPFMDIDGLCVLARAIQDAGIVLDYVETNAFWVSGASAGVALEKLLRAGVNTLCISFGTYHAEYVPPENPLKLAELCRQNGIDYFLWEAKGLTYGGRAINIEMEHAPRRPAEELTSGRPCRRLVSGSHFHADLYVRYVPPGCTGIALPLAEAVNGIPAGKYPVFEALYKHGTAGLLQYAAGRGFTPDSDGYSSVCALCFYLRHWLAENAPSPELDTEHYAASLEYYARGECCDER